MIRCEKDRKEFQMLQKLEETLHELGNVHVCNNGISSIHGKELPEQLSFHREYKRPHTVTNVRHIYNIGV